MHLTTTWWKLRASQNVIISNRWIIRQLLRAGMPLGLVEVDKAFQFQSNVYVHILCIKLCSLRKLRIDSIACNNEQLKWTIISISTTKCKAVVVIYHTNFLKYHNGNNRTVTHYTTVWWIDLRYLWLQTIDCNTNTCTVCRDFISGSLSSR